MPGAVFLRGERINLRTLEEEDLSFLRENINDPDVRTYLTARRPQNMNQEKEFFQEIVSSQEDVHLAVCRDEEIVGMISLEEDVDAVQVANIGLWIDPQFQRNGYGTEAAELITDYGFKELGYHRISAQAYSENEGSNRIWEKLGFEKEGTLREKSFSEGRFEDVNIYGVLKNEWQQA